MVSAGQRLLVNLARPPLVGAEEKPGHPLVTVWVTIMQQDRCAQCIRITRLIGMYASISPEDIKIARNKFYFDGVKQIALDQ